jgi:hypothetical protein
VEAVQAAGSQPPPDDLDVYLDLTRDQIAHLVLCLIIEELLRDRLVAFRQNPSAQPVQRLEKLGV